MKKFKIKIKKIKKGFIRFFKKKRKKEFLWR